MHKVHLEASGAISWDDLSAPAEVVLLGRDEVDLSTGADLERGASARLEFRIPFRHQAIEVGVECLGPVEDASAPGPLLRFRFLDLASGTRLDIDRVLEEYGGPGSGSPAERAEGPVPGFPEVVGDRFQVVAPVGPDELSIRLRGLDGRTGRRVLVRFLRSNRERGDDWSPRLLELLDSLLPFEHPNVLRVLGLHEIEGRPVVVSEWSDEPLLELRLRAEHPVELEAATLLVGQILSVMAALRDAELPYGILHPGRVHLSPIDGVKLADLGVAQLAPVARAGDHREAAFFAPPEVRLGQESSFRSEAYSIGLIYHSMLLGRVPSEPGADRGVKAGFSARPLDPAQTLPDLPDAVHAWIDRATQPNPGKRFESPGAMIGALKAAVEATRVG